MVEKSVVQRVRELEAERSKLVTHAKAHALEQARAAIADLKELGFSYALVEEDQRRRRTAMRQSVDRACPVCKFRTIPAHDARKHRGQGAKKVPFTSKDLAAFRLVKA